MHMMGHDAAVDGSWARMKDILFKSSLLTLACVFLKLASALAIAPLIHLQLDPFNWYVFVLSPVAVAMPVAIYWFWKDRKLRLALVEVEDAHLRLQAAHRLLAEKAEHDQMTGMLTREAFFNALNHAIATEQAGALLIIDADNFKAINDTFGHMAGDNALQHISEAITSTLRESDIVGRIGGEEFAVFLSGANESKAQRIADRIRWAVGAIHFMPTPGQPRALSVSIGGAVASERHSLEHLMRTADRRLYAAKNAGRNRTLISPESHTDEPDQVLARRA